MMHRVKLKLVIAGLAAAAAVVALYPPARLGALVLAGRGQGCPFSQAIRSADNLKQQIALKDKILKASRLVETDPAGYRLYETPDGPYWIPEGSQYVLPFNLAEMARKIYGEGERDIQPGDVVLDCGANVGVFARAALKAGARTVVAIEPAPENIECLRRNFAQEIEAGSVIVYPKGVWHKDAFLTLHVDPRNSAANSFLIQREGSHAIEKVPLTTIDALVEELQLDRVDFIKMDIEGAELNALQGARKSIARFHPRMALSVYHAPDHPRTIPELARKANPGYRIECGPCAEANNSVRPEILYFY